MTERIPAEVFPVGEFLRDELEARGWTQAYLADIMNRPAQVINGIIAGRKAITPETAQGLADALGTTAELWLNLQSVYRLAQVRDKESETRRRARLYSLAPVKEMTRRGWIANVRDTNALERELEKFFESPTLDPNLKFAAKMSTNYAQFTPSQIAWAVRARKLARAVSAAKFQDSALQQGLVDLRQLVASEHDVRRVPKLLAEIGIRLVVVAHLPTTRIDGAAMWLNDQSPVVALSLRYDRIDNFWFTLLHELMHVKHRDEDSLDTCLVGADREPTEEKPEKEQKADREAQNFLVPLHEIEGFMNRVGPLYSSVNKIVHFANRIRVHPGIVTGQLQFRAKRYTFGTSLLVKVRSAVIEAALSDGWGYTPPLR